MVPVVSRQVLEIKKESVLIINSLVQRKYPDHLATLIRGLVFQWYGNFRYPTLERLTSKTGIWNSNYYRSKFILLPFWSTKFILRPFWSAKFILLPFWSTKFILRPFWSAKFILRPFWSAKFILLPFWSAKFILRFDFPVYNCTLFNRENAIIQTKNARRR